MDENSFWSIVECSISKTNDQEEQAGKLINALSRLTPEEIIGFRLRTDYLLHVTYSSQLWCASYLIIDWASDDIFEYFRLWIISKGKKAYYAAKENPDSLIEILNEGDEYEFEHFWYVANTAFQEKTGKDLYDFIDHDNFIFGEGNYPHLEFIWKPDDPESLKANCPKLFMHFTQ